jgi:hypothetical protein
MARHSLPPAGSAPKSKGRRQEFLPEKASLRKQKKTRTAAGLFLFQRTLIRFTGLF